MSGFWRATLAIIALHICTASPAIATQNDIVILLANSESMRQNDPDSLTARAVEGYLQRISGDSRVAILAFSSYVLRIQSFTASEPGALASLLQRIQEMQPAGTHSNSAAGVERSIYELNTHGRPSARKTIILVTDTHIHTGDHERDLDFERWLREILVQEAVAAQIRIFGIALGEQADIQNLQTLAFRTGGDYYEAADATEIASLLSRIQEKITQITPRPVLSNPSEQSLNPSIASPVADQQVTSEPSGDREDNAAAVTKIQQPADSPTLSSTARTPSSGTGEQTLAKNNRTNEALESEGLTAARLFLLILMVCVVFFSLATYLLLRNKKRREPSPAGSPAPPHNAEFLRLGTASGLVGHRQAKEVNHGRATKKATDSFRVSERLTPLSNGATSNKSANPVSKPVDEGDTEELPIDSENKKATAPSQSNQPNPARLTQQESTGTADGKYDAEEDTQEIPELGFENTVIKASVNASQSSSKRNKTPTSQSLPGNSEEDDNTSLRQND